MHDMAAGCEVPLSKFVMNPDIASDCCLSHSMLQIQAMAAMQDEFGPKSVTVLVTWVDGQVHFEVRLLSGDSTLQSRCVFYARAIRGRNVIVQCGAHASLRPHLTKLIGSSCCPITSCRTGLMRFLHT